MFIDRMLNQNQTPVLEQMMRFTESRQSLLAEDIANVSTPNFRQKDLSVEQFQKQLSEKTAEQATAAPGEVDFNNISMDTQNPNDGILFHDGNNRSIEKLMTDQAKNALMHNVAVELLRQQYQTMDMALKEKPG